MSILKKFSFILFLLMFENIDAEAQFSYTHSDGTVISCQQTPLKADEYEGELYKKYAEVANNKIMLYSTSAKISTPNELTSVSAEAIPLTAIKFDAEHFAVTVQDTDEQHPMTIMFIYTSPQVAQNYVQKDGVKSKEEPTTNTNATIEFPTHESAIAFVEELIAKLPVEKQAGAKTVFENTYYGMVGEEKRQQGMKARAEANRLKAKRESNMIEINNKTFYMDANAVYNWDFEKIASRTYTSLTFNDPKITYSWSSNNNNRVTKNGNTKYYVKSVVNSDVFYDSTFDTAYLTSKYDNSVGNKYFVFKQGKEIGYYKIAFMATQLVEIACLIDYFEL